MEPELFSFSKKPIELPTHHKPSVISTQLPSESGSRLNSASSGPTRALNRSFSSSSQTNTLVDANMMADDPLLDYNEQIRAPKFRQPKSSGGIGESLDKQLLNEVEGDKLVDLIRVKTDSNVNKNYQPAEVDVSKIRSALPSSLSQGHEQSIYTIDDFLQNVTQNHATQLINNLNLDYTTAHKDIDSNDSTESASEATSSVVTANTSPISSKKPSHESINYNFIESNKQPRFNQIPVKQIDELKSPNYLPCVLRTTSNTYNELRQSTGTNLSRVKSNSITEDQNDITYKPHWKPNKSRSQCLDCQKPFSLMNRRHHCRKCGEIFCGNCLVFKANLTYDESEEIAKFDSVNGITCKVCFQCGKNWSNHLFKEYKDTEEQTSPLYNNLKVDNTKQSTTGRFPRVNPPIASTVNTMNNSSNEANLVPADWTWSSF